jgi:hypothetical protein
MDRPSDVDFIWQVHKSSIKLQHWNNSVVDLATKFDSTTMDIQPGEENNKIATRRRLDTLQMKRP